MKTTIKYIELKSGFSDNGPAWIGEIKYSKTRTTIYFNNKAFIKANTAKGNYIDIETGDEYWISSVKKKGTDRHWAGNGKIIIDKNIVDKYLKITGKKELGNNYTVQDIPAIYPIERIKNKENAKLI